jgi:hypothetical protein
MIGLTAHRPVPKAHQDHRVQAPEWPLGIRPDCTGVRPRLPVVVQLLDDDEEIITGFRSAPVESLPVPRHLRWPCAFEREHLEAVAAVGEEREAFLRFLAEMAPRLHECEYHQVDWRLVAGAATAASEARASRRGTELADEAGRIATETGADRATVEWVESLFLDQSRSPRTAISSIGASGGCAR